MEEHRLKPAGKERATVSARDANVEARSSRFGVVSSVATVVDNSWRSLYRLGGITALIAMVLVPAEVVISLFPEVGRATARTITVIDWFSLFQDNCFLALRNLGLLNLLGAMLLVPTMLALCGALAQQKQAYAALGAILFFMGIAVYFASSRAFPMYSLSRQYAVATSEAQRSLVAAAGQAMLAEGESRTGILIIEFACLVISWSMLGNKIFSKATACAGIVGSALMMILEIAFIPPRGFGMIVAAAGGLSTVTWYFLTGRRLLQLATDLTVLTNGQKG